MLFQRVLIPAGVDKLAAESLRPVLFQRVLILKRWIVFGFPLFETRAISEGAHSETSGAS